MSEIKVGKVKYKVREITLDLRMEVLDKAMVAAKLEKFSSFVDIIRMVVYITDEQLMDLSTDKISEIGRQVVELCNAGKKPMKSK